MADFPVAHAMVYCHINLQDLEHLPKEADPMAGSGNHGGPPLVPAPSSDRSLYSGLARIWSLARLWLRVPHQLAD